MFYSPLRTFAARSTVMVACLFSLVGGRAYALKLSGRDGAILATYPAGNGPYSVAFDGASVWVTNSRDNTVSKF